MQYDYVSYSEAKDLMDRIDLQLGDHLVVKMEEDFDQKLTETDYKKRAKANKAFLRDVQEVSPFCEVLYPMQIRMKQIRTNLTFLLEGAHNKVSYKAVAKYFAEYDFLAKEIKKEAKKCKNAAMKGFLEDSTVLDTDFFKTMMDTLSTMQANIRERMRKHPEQYIDLNIEEDSEFVMDDVKAAFKNAQKDLKEARKKQLASS